MSQSGMLAVSDNILPPDVPTSFTTDLGTAVPVANNIKIYAQTSGANSGSSVKFTASSNEIDLNVTDSFLNTLIGEFSGNALLATPGAANTGLGYATLRALTTGTTNTAFGYSALTSLTTGSNNIGVGNGALGNGASFTDNTIVGTSGGSGITSLGIQNTGVGSSVLGNLADGTNNIALGYRAGVNLHGSNSSNISIGNAATNGDSNKIKIGTQGSGAGQQNQCFIAGIAAVAISNALPVVIDSTTGQLGTSGSLTSTWSDVSGAFSPIAGNGYFITGTATGTLPASPSQGDTIEFFVDHASQLLTIQASGTQIIRMGVVVSSAGGTFVSTARGDSCKLVYRLSDTCWCAVTGIIGTWNNT